MRQSEKVKVFKQQEDNEIDSDEIICKNKALRKINFKSNQMIPLPNFYTSKFVEFFQGNEAIQDSQHSEFIKERVVKSIEEIDYLEGLQVFSDCDSGFGAYS